MIRPRKMATIATARTSGGWARIVWVTSFTVCEIELKKSTCPPIGGVPALAPPPPTCPAGPCEIPFPYSTIALPQLDRIVRTLRRSRHGRNRQVSRRAARAGGHHACRGGGEGCGERLRTEDIRGTRWI